MNTSHSASVPYRTPQGPPAPNRRAALIIGGTGALLAVALVVWVLRGDDHSSAPGAVGSGGTIAVGHIHGIGIDPGDDRLYVGAHEGVFAVGDSGEVQPVGTERFDTMGFTVAGPGRFLASGHPQLDSNRAPHLGLFESSDAAATWSSASLEGEADFHALDSTETRIWGADSVGGRLLTSSDGREWDLLAEGQFIDVAADPTDPERVLATDSTGQLRSYAATGDESGLSGAPVLTFLDWPTDDELVGLAPDGTTLLSRDQGATWQARARLPGSPSAFEAGDEAWYAASDAGLFTSSDDGATWTPLFTYQGTP